MLTERGSDLMRGRLFHAVHQIEMSELEGMLGEATGRERRKRVSENVSGIAPRMSL